jgi:hypothetical protein
MKRIFSIALFGAAAAVLGGCPVYPDNSNGYRVCDQSTCYDCPNDYLSNDCFPVSCGSNGDCPYGYACNSYTGQCSNGNNWDGGGPVPVPDATAPTPCSQPSQCPPNYTCGAAGVCQLGDCSVTGCAPGYVCELENGTLTCVSTGQPTDAAPPPVDAGPPDSGVACQSNADCASTPGALCLDGVCVPPADQCYDGTQCPPGDKCVQGACTPTCQVTADGGGSSCPTGYSCTDIGDASTSGVCTGNPEPCESNPGICPPGTVCAQNHCTASCGAGATCPAGEECVQGGCVPKQDPRFLCSTDGVQDTCAAGSICIHHSCYIACSADAGPDSGASTCQSAAQFNECKPVAASGATYYVCGSATNFGTECNPTLGQACSSPGAVCIDGFCH